MTVEQFRLLRVGDIVLDGNHRNAPRKIFKISRVNGKSTQRGHTRTAITCTNLKQSSTHTIIFVSDETGPPRFSFPETP